MLFSKEFFVPKELLRVWHPLTSINTLIDTVDVKTYLLLDT